MDRRRLRRRVCSDDVGRGCGGPGVNERPSNSNSGCRTCRSKPDRVERPSWRSRVRLPGDSADDGFQHRRSLPPGHRAIVPWNRSASRIFRELWSRCPACGGNRRAHARRHARRAREKSALGRPTRAVSMAEVARALVCWHPAATASQLPSGRTKCRGVLCSQQPAGFQHTLATAATGSRLPRVSDHHPYSAASKACILGANRA